MHFDVHVQPVRSGLHEGTLAVHELRIWKHVLPDHAPLLPEVSRESAVALLLTVRDLQSSSYLSFTTLYCPRPGFPLWHSRAVPGLLFSSNRKLPH